MPGLIFKRVRWVWVTRKYCSENSASVHVGGGEFQRNGGQSTAVIFQKIADCNQMGEMVMLEGNQAPAIFIQRLVLPPIPVLLKKI